MRQIIFTVLFLLASTASFANPGVKPEAAVSAEKAPANSKTATSETASSESSLKVATFAGGCFWCMEPPFDDMPGVSKTISGYMGGSADNANYDRVSSGKTRHREVVQVTYDPAKVSYEDLLYVFWRNVDPLEKRGQFCDFGPQYTAAIYFQNEDEKRLAWKSLQELRKNPQFGQKVATQIEKAAEFYPAEEYHQDYYLRNPVRYKYYRYRCGRDKQLKALWGDEAKGLLWPGYQQSDAVSPEDND